MISDFVQGEHETALLVFEHHAHALETEKDRQVLLEQSYELRLTSLGANGTGQPDGLHHFVLHVQLFRHGLKLIEFEAEDRGKQANGVLVDHGEARVTLVLRLRSVLGLKFGFLRLLLC